MNILEIDNFIPEKVCKGICEAFDESQEGKGEREYIRGKDLECIRLDMRSMANQKAQSKWLDYTKSIAKSMKDGFRKYSAMIGSKESVRFRPEPPHVHRYDPEFGFHNSTIFNNKRLISCIFYLNDTIKGETIFEVDGKQKKIKPKMGKAIFFPATKEYKFKDTSGKKYLKYVIKGHIIKA